MLSVPELIESAVGTFLETRAEESQVPEIAREFLFAASKRRADSSSLSVAAASSSSSPKPSARKSASAAFAYPGHDDTDKRNGNALLLLTR